jgi:hypothetical protein
MYQVFEQINELRREIRGRRKGYYVSLVTDAVQSFRRLQHAPEWLAEGAPDLAKRIGSPILDVIPAVGSRLAMISQDGDPDRAAWFGQVWDELASELTVWIRANLASDPGRIELGANKSIHIRIGSAGDDTSGEFTLTPLDDGTVRIQTASGQFVIDQDGKIYVGNGLINLVTEVKALAALVDSLCEQLGLAQVPTSIGAQFLTTAGTITGTIQPLVQDVVDNIGTIEG